MHDGTIVLQVQESAQFSARLQLPDEAFALTLPPNIPFSA